MRSIWSNRWGWTNSPQTNNFDFNLFHSHSLFFLGVDIAENSSLENLGRVFEDHLDLVTPKRITIVGATTDNAANVINRFNKNPIERFNFPTQACLAGTC
jgi:hypothetical protein